MGHRLASALVLGGLGVSVACSAEDPAPASNTAGTTGVVNGGSAGAAVAQAGTSTSAGTMQGGATTTAGASAGGSAPTAGTNATSGAGGSASGGSAGTGGGGPVVKASCADNAYDLCIDFETGIDKAVWTGGTDNAIITTDVAHGTHSYRLYPQPGGKLVASKLGKITNQMWGRFYVHFKPGAPGGHGNIVGAFDMSNNWYEMGWQFDGMMGVWHATGGNERPLRSKPYIVDKWYCIETFFDGTKTEMPKWWIDGKEAEYYMSANEQLIPKVVTQFARVEVGFTPYAGLGLMLPDQNEIKDDRVLTDMAIDDIAFNTTRIGCITQ
ncbi:MAG TPA: hypothetical protein VHP33_12185 [Polyangiaceae bacterium]|nr:hypothetical protein [Polyangiaceae bacterium]